VWVEGAENPLVQSQCAWPGNQCASGGRWSGTGTGADRACAFCSTDGRGGAAPVRQGQHGISRANPPGVQQPTIKLTDGRTIRPDSIAGKVVHEVKYYLRTKLGYTQQIRTYHEYTLSTGGKLTIHLNSDAKISGTLQEMVNNGSIGLVIYVP
jgi:hypothetical protein